MRTFLPLLLLSLASCSKETRVINTYPAKLPFRVNGVNDLTIQRNPFRNYLSQEELIVRVLYGFGDKRSVKLSVEDSYAGICTRLTVTNGYPDFASSLLLTDSLKAPGVLTKCTSRHNPIAVRLKS